jgi:4-hydroxy-tetrahydrodipicolinate synthase
VTATFESFRGVNASVPIPFADGSPDYEAFGEYLEWLASQGVSGITVNADTSEGAHLEWRERIALVRTARTALDETIPVVSGLVASHTAQAVELGTELRGAGADGLLVFSPPAFIGDPLPDELVLDYFEAVAAVGLPLVAFSLTPRLGGTVLSPSALRRLGAAGLIAAVKEASFDPVVYLTSRDAVRSIERPIAFLTGCDNFIYESIVLGADGCLLGFSSLAAAQTVRLLELVNEGRLGDAESLNQECIAPLAQAIFAPPMRDSRARIKYGLSLLGLMDSTTVRRPLLELDENERAKLRVTLDNAGLTTVSEAPSR